MNEATYKVEYSDSRGCGVESVQKFTTYREAAEAFNAYGVRTVSTASFDPVGDQWDYSSDDYGHPVAYTCWGNGVETLYLTDLNPSGLADEVWEDHESDECPRCVTTTIFATCPECGSTYASKDKYAASTVAVDCCGHLLTHGIRKYSVHMGTNGSAGYARDYIGADTLDAARAMFADFAVGVDAYTVDLEDPGAWCDVYTYDHRDNVNETHGDPETRRVARFELGPLGGIRRTV